MDSGIQLNRTYPSRVRLGHSASIVRNRALPHHQRSHHSRGIFVLASLCAAYPLLKDRKYRTCLVSHGQDAVAGHKGRQSSKILSQQILQSSAVSLVFDDKDYLLVGIS